MYTKANDKKIMVKTIVGHGFYITALKVGKWSSISNKKNQPV